MGLSREQFVQTVLQILRVRFPLESVAEAPVSFAIKINGHIASLENLYRMAKLRPDDLRHQAERWMVELLRAADTPDTSVLEDVRARIFPMIVPDFRVPPVASVTRPFIQGLSIAYAIDNDRTISYIHPKRFAGWKLDIEQLHDQAIENLVNKSQEMNAHAAHDDKGKATLLLFQSLDGYDASRILLPALHDRLRSFLGSPFAAAIPNRDILLCFRSDPETVERMRDQVRGDYDRMPHQISSELLLITMDGVAPLV